MGRNILLFSLALVISCGVQAQDALRGKAVYDVQCAPCHATGLLGSPRTGDAAAWAKRTAAGINAVYANAIKGKGSMPARGGDARLTDAQIIAAINYMLKASPGVASDKGEPANAKGVAVAATDSGKGRTVYQSACAACHATGAAGAPKLGDGAAWAPRVGAGAAALQASALKGKGAMPPKGGNMALPDADVRAAVGFMLAQVGPGAAAPAAAPATPAVAAPAQTTADAGKGRTVYQSACAACHSTGVAGAPKLGDGAAWTPRINAGMAALQTNALKGKGAMPPKGGNASLADADVRAAVAYIVAQTRGVAATPAVAAAGTPPVMTAPTAPAPSTPPVLAVAPPPQVQAANDPNAFNRLLAPPSKRNAAPANDGIHDASSPGTMLLQAPLASFTTLARSTTGNYVDWVAAIGKKQIQPRWDARDAKAEPTVMDLTIVREVKGTMPDVVFPHKQHTEWLDCSNCHPAIFVPQKGANQISMAAIMLGQKCGVCHGKVAFPVSECRLCHSRAKPAQAAREGKR